MTVKIWRWTFNRRTPRIFYNRRIKPIIRPEYKKKNIWYDRFVVNVCNYCNLSCFSCSGLCNIPMGSNVYRNHPREQKPEHLDTFLKLISGYRSSAWIRFTGGEPTAIEPKKLIELSRISRKHGRRTCLLTNGFRLLEIDPYEFDYIQLDNHGPNENLIKKCVAYLRKLKYEQFEVEDHLEHRNLSLQRNNNVSWGLRCPAWMDQVTLWEDVVYPCCNMYYLDGWENNTETTKALKDAGWTINNKELAKTLVNWRKTIPGQAVKTCSLSCWNGSKNIEWVKI